MANKKIQIIPPDGGYVDVLHPETSAEQVKLADVGGNFTATDVEGAMSELFTNVNDGKTVVANAITTKGVTASPADTFSTLANKIGQIETASLLTGTATPAQVLSGATFYSNNPDTKLTGTMPTQGAQTITPGTTNKTIASGRYLTGTQTIAGDADLIAANIRQGKNIFGVSGSAPPDGSKYAEGVTDYANEGLSGLPFWITKTVGFRPRIVVLFAKDRATTVKTTTSYMADAYSSYYVVNGTSMSVSDEGGYISSSGFKLKISGTNSTDTWYWAAIGY